MMFWRRKNPTDAADTAAPTPGQARSETLEPGSEAAHPAAALDQPPREIVDRSAEAAPGEVHSTHRGASSEQRAAADVEPPESDAAAMPAAASADPAEAAASQPTASEAPPSEAPASEAQAPQVTEDQVVAALQEVFDPEIPVNIYELGLIYAVLLNGSETRPGGTDVDVKMTLTSPHCPVAETLPGDVARAVRTVPGVGEVDVEVVWDPTWNPDMMSEAAKLELGMF